MAIVIKKGIFVPILLILVSSLRSFSRKKYFCCSTLKLYGPYEQDTEGKKRK